MIDEQSVENYPSTSNVQIQSYSLPSPTYDILQHHQPHLFNNHKPKEQHIQIYSDSNAFNSHLLQSSSLPVLTPLNLNLKYVEYQSNNAALSSGSDSESLNEQSKTRAKKNLPHKKRLKKLNSDQFSIIQMPEDRTAVQSIVSKFNFISIYLTFYFLAPVRVHRMFRINKWPIRLLHSSERALRAN